MVKKTVWTKVILKFYKDLKFKIKFYRKIL